MGDNHTALGLICERLESHREKYNRILELENSGLTLNEDQEQVLRSKPIVAALIEDYISFFQKHNLSQVSAISPTVNQNKGDEEKRIKKKKNTRKSKTEPKRTEETMAAELRAKHAVKCLMDKKYEEAMAIELRANHAAKCLRDNRTSMKNVLTRWSSFPEMKVDVIRYIHDVDAHICRIKSEIDLNDELKILESLYNKLDPLVEKLKIETRRAGLSYLQAGLEIIEIPGVKDLISSDPEILNDDSIREVIMSTGKFDLIKWLRNRKKMIEKKKGELDELLACTKYRESELKDQQQTVESLLYNQNEKEAYQLRDKTEIEGNTLENKEVKKNHLMSLNERLVSAISRMDELFENYSADLYHVHFRAHWAIKYCRARLSSHSRKLSGKEESKPEDSVN